MLVGNHRLFRILKGPASGTDSEGLVSRSEVSFPFSVFPFLLKFWSGRYLKEGYQGSIHSSPYPFNTDSIIYLFLALSLVRHTEGSKKAEEDHLPITPESPRLSAKVSGSHLRTRTETATRV